MWLLRSVGCPPRRRVGNFPSGSVGSYISIPQNHHGDESSAFWEHIRLSLPEEACSV